MKNFYIRAKDGKVEGFNEDKEKEWKGPFTFIQAADPQFGYLTERENLEEGTWDEEIRRAKLAVSCAKNLKPKPCFFIVCGDMTHAYQEEKYRKEQYQEFIDIFSELEPEIPLLCVCGNHDVGNTPTPETIMNFRETYGDDYYSFWCGGVLFIVINSQYYADSSLVEELSKEHDQWLDKVLNNISNKKPKHVIILQHIPWFLKYPEEEEEYFNIKKVTCNKMLEKFYKSGVNAIFCGHYHRNAGGFYKEMEEVVTTAIGYQLGSFNPGMRVVKLYDDKIKHEFHELENFPKIIEL